MQKSKRVVVAGATGLIGTPLCASLQERGFDVIRLVRKSGDPGSYRDVLWEGKGVGPWAAELDGAEAVINLAGRSVACRWTPANRREILESRTESTKAIGEAILRCKKAPQVWINSSATGFYGDRGDEELTESSPPGSGFLADVCVAWEREMFGLALPATRCVAVRTGIVLANEGGTLPILRRLAKFGLGGTIGSGRQWWSAIHLDDLVRLYMAAVTDPLEGPLNGVLPKPEQNADFMMVLRHTARVPFGIPAPAFGVRLVGEMVGPDASLSLTSTRVIPVAAREAGFTFRFPTLDTALTDLIR